MLKFLHESIINTDNIVKVYFKDPKRLCINDIHNDNTFIPFNSTYSKEEQIKYVDLFFEQLNDKEIQTIDFVKIYEKVKNVKAN